MDPDTGRQSEVWTHPSLEVRRSPISGEGLFATAGIEHGVVVIRLGGRLVSTAELHRLFAGVADHGYIDTFAVDDDTHIVLPPATSAHYSNHSCEPTMWPVSTYELATRRSVEDGEELTIDYGLISDDPTFQMRCMCGTASCRHMVTGEDWRRPDLQQRYAGHWPSGLQRRILSEQSKRNRA